MKRPFTQDELQELSNRGYDVSEYKGELADFPDPPPTSPVAASARAAGASALPTLAGGAGFGLTMLALAPETLGASLLAIPAAAAVGYAGSKLASKGQEAVMPESWKEKLAADVAEHPVATTLGGIATMPLAGMSPSVANLGKAAGAVTRLAGRLPTTLAEQQALLNVGAGAALGGVQEAATAKLEGRDITPGSVALGAALGAGFSSPNAIGRRLYGFHPTPEQVVSNPRLLAKTLEVAKEQQAPRQPIFKWEAPDIFSSEEQIRRSVGIRDKLTKSAETSAKAIFEAEKAGQPITPRDDPSINKTIDEITAKIKASDKKKSIIPPAKTEVDVTAPSAEAPKGPEVPRTELFNEVVGKLYVPTAVTPEYVDTLIREVMAKHKIKVTPDGNLTNEKGEPINGKALLLNAVREILFNPKTATIDTIPHEGLHYLRTEMEMAAHNGDKAAQTLLQRWDALNKPEFDTINALRRERGLPEQDPHEFAVSQQGYEFVKQQFGLNKEGPVKRWWNDTKALFNAKYRTKSATLGDLRRAINFRFVHEGTIKPQVGFGGAKRGQPADEGLIPKGYRQVNLVKPDGTKEPVYFNDKYYEGFGEPKPASIAKLVDGVLSHGATRKGERIEEIGRNQDQNEGLPLNPEWRQDQQEELDALYRPQEKTPEQQKFEEMHRVVDRAQGEDEGLPKPSKEELEYSWDAWEARARILGEAVLKVYPNAGDKYKAVRVDPIEGVGKTMIEALANNNPTAKKLVDVLIQKGVIKAAGSNDWIRETVAHMNNVREDNGFPRLEYRPQGEDEGLLRNTVLHTVRNESDIPDIIKNGLRAGTNVSMEGDKPNQSLGNGVTLVYDKDSVAATSKGYNPNDGLVSRRTAAKPKAILVETGDIIEEPPITMDELSAKIEQLQNQSKLRESRLQEKYNAAKAQHEARLKNIEAVKNEDGSLTVKTAPTTETVKGPYDPRTGISKDIERQIPGRQTRYSIKKFGDRDYVTSDRGLASSMREGESFETAAKRLFAEHELNIKEPTDLLPKRDYSTERQLDTLYNKLDRMIEQNVESLPGFTSADYVKSLNLPKDIPVFTYEANEDGGITPGSLKRHIESRDQPSDEGLTRRKEQMRINAAAQRERNRQAAEELRAGKPARERGPLEGQPQGGRPLHTPLDQKKPVDIRTDQQAEDVRTYAARAVNGVLRHIRNAKDVNSYSIAKELGKAHDLSDKEFGSTKDDLVSEVYSEYVKNGEDTDGMLPTLNRIAGRKVREWLTKRKESGQSMDEQVGEDMTRADVTAAEEKETPETLKQRYLSELEEERKYAVEEYGEGSDQVDEIDQKIAAIKGVGSREQPANEGLFTTKATKLLRTKEIKPSNEDTYQGDQLLGALRNRLSPVEYDALKMAGLEDYVKGRYVKRDDVQKWIAENGPKVEVHSYGMEGKVSEAAKELGVLRHTIDSQQNTPGMKDWVDTLDMARTLGDIDNIEDKIRNERFSSYTPKERNQMGRYADLHRKMLTEPKDTTPKMTGQQVGAYERVSAFLAKANATIKSAYTSLAHIFRANPRSLEIPLENTYLGKTPEDYVWEQPNGKYMVNPNPHVGPMDSIHPGKLYNTKEEAVKAAQQLHEHLQILDHLEDHGIRPKWCKSTIEALLKGEELPTNAQRVDITVDEPASKTTGVYDTRIGGIRPKNKWEADNIHEQYPNTLGWAMIQYKTGPKGEKVAVIGEVQSRWGQSLRDFEKSFTIEKVGDKYEAVAKETRSDGSGKYIGFGGKTPEEALASAYETGYKSVKPHPLLRDYNRLILKAAIEQARKEGATHIVISDAETAMMSEGHDTQANYPAQNARARYEGQWGLRLDDGTVSWMRDKEQAEKNRGWHGGEIIQAKASDVGKVEISQEPGMRLNYDKILPRIAEELTGAKGERVSLGEHKNAYEYRIPAEEQRLQNVAPEPNRFRKDLIFRNPDGTPKTDASGMMYPLEQVSKRLDSGDKFTLFNKYQPANEGLLRQTESPEFKRWFGDSKVVDKEGRPLVVYHGTASDPFSKFNTEGYRARGYQFGEGAYFTPDAERASHYTGVKQSDIDKASDDTSYTERRFYDETQSPRVYPVFVSLKKPYHISSDAAVSDIGYKLNRDNTPEYVKLAKEIAAKNNYSTWQTVGTTEVGNLWLRKQGYDGIIKAWKPGDILELVAFHPEQIKSAIGNKGTFDPSNPDIREQGSNEGLTSRVKSAITDKEGFLSGMAPTFDKVKPLSPALAQAGHNWEARRDQYLGMRNEVIDKLQRFDPEDVNAVSDLHRTAWRNDEELPVLTGDKKEISKLLTQYYHNYIGKARRDMGLRIGSREAGLNKYYVPDQLNEDTIALFTKNPNSVEANAAKRDWANHVANESEGKIPFDEALENITNYVEALGGGKNNYLSVNFGAIRKASGYGLPDSMRETDALKSMYRYGRRAASDLAMFQELESRPEIASLLKIPNPNTGKIPDHPQGLPALNAEQRVKDMMKWVTQNFGNTMSQDQPRVNALVRTVNNALLGPATGLRDTATVPLNAVPYITNFRDLGAFFKGLTTFREHADAALRTGARQPNIDLTQFNTILEAPDRATAVLHKAGTILRKYQGREAIENLNRDIVFSVGKELANSWIIGAKNGDTRAANMLKKFSTLVPEDVTTLRGAELEAATDQIAKNFTDRNQGTYGGRGLPVGVVESQFAPFLSLQKWSIEKSNVIWQDVVKPFLTGENRMPLLTYTLGALMTGAGIQELNKLLTGRKAQDPTLKEAMEKGDTAAYVTQLATLMQLASYAGIVGDITKATSDVLIRGKQPRNVVSFPTATATLDTTEKLTDALEAFRQGEDPFEVVKKLTIDLATHNVQAVRMVANRTVKKEELERSDKFRDRRVFNELEGKPASDIPKSNQYLGLDTRAFKRADTASEVQQLAPVVIRKAIEKSKGNPEQLRIALRNLKANSYQTVPSPTENPFEFAAYYKFLVNTQGKEAADSRVRDYLTQTMLNKVKSRLVPGSR